MSVEESFVLRPLSASMAPGISLVRGFLRVSDGTSRTEELRAVLAYCSKVSVGLISYYIRSLESSSSEAFPAYRNVFVVLTSYYNHLSKHQAHSFFDSFFATIIQYAYSCTVSHNVVVTHLSLDSSIRILLYGFSQGCLAVTHLSYV